MMNKPTINFEDSLRDLEMLVKQLEQGDLSLEDSLKAFESGIKLTRECNQQLEEAEQKINLLVGEENDLRLTEFSNTSENSLEEDDKG